MILYQLAKWMEERTRLMRTIEESQGDISFLLHKKEQADERMLEQASKWTGSALFEEDEGDVTVSIPIPLDFSVDQAQELAT